MIAFPQKMAPLAAALLVSLSAAFRAAAHEPLDISSRLVARDDRIELTATLGLDAARQLLAAADLSPEKISDALRARGPNDTVEQPASVARHLFRLAIDGEPLTAEKVTSLAEGMEVIVTAIFPRFPGRRMEVHATCYATIPELRRGVLTALDAADGKLGAALFSTNNQQLAISLPPAQSPAANAGASPQKNR